jgi:hypothetical protein
MIRSALLAATMITMGAPAMATHYPADNGLMADVPGHGLSRVETITFCLEEAGVGRYQDLFTDSQVESFSACLSDQT